MSLDDRWLEVDVAAVHAASCHTMQKQGPTGHGASHLFQSVQQETTWGDSILFALIILTGHRMLTSASCWPTVGIDSDQSSVLILDLLLRTWYLSSP